MGLGGYLAARSDAEHYHSELKREWLEVKELPDREDEEVAEVFRGYGLTEEQIAPVLEAFHARPEKWVDFMMRFELGLDAPNPGRALTSALTIAAAYVVGGLIPLAPYFLGGDVHASLRLSVAVTLAALAVFGYVKGRFTGAHAPRSALQTVMVGGLAAGAAFALAKAFS
jgi:VIT1/CCC1 family predicted Fe2+/Mn2+ transporter